MTPEEIDVSIQFLIKIAEVQDEKIRALQHRVSYLENELFGEK